MNVLSIALSKIRLEKVTLSIKNMTMIVNVYIFCFFILFFASSPNTTPNRGDDKKLPRIDKH